MDIRVCFFPPLPTDGCWWPCWESSAKTILIITMPPPLPESLGRRACSFNGKWEVVVVVEHQRKWLHMLPLCSILFHLCLIIKNVRCKHESFTGGSRGRCSPATRVMWRGRDGAVNGEWPWSPGDSYITNTATMLEKHCSCCISSLVILRVASIN